MPQDALRQWRAALPAEAVRTDPAELARAAACTFAWPADIRAILVPQDREQVRRLLRIASATGHPVHPYGRGCNWGLGSRLPSGGPCALVDLSAMNRIVDHDPVLGTLTVEPGVHFAQAAAFLRDQGSDFFCSVTGGPALGSLIGNALERGGGDGPLGERAAHMTALEWVLGSGEVIHTGFARFGHASTARLSREGVGPSLVGLACQSGYGIITQATFFLARRPATWRLLMAEVPRTAALPGLLDALRRLLQDQVTFPHAATLWNRFKLAARQGPYAADDPCRPPQPTGADGGPWTLSLSLQGPSAAIADALAAHAAQQLQAHAAELQVMADHEFAPADRRALDFGVPTGRNMLSTYWRKKGPAPVVPDTQPDRDRCGVLWLCPALPLDGPAVAQALAGVERRMLAHGFEPNIGINPVSPRLMEAYVALMYDREVPGEDARAMACHHEVMRGLLAQGHLPYRLGVQSASLMPAPADDSGAVLRRLRSVFDPRGVLAAGRPAG